MVIVLDNVACARPPMIDGAEVDDTSSDKFQVGATAKYTCHEGE